MPKKKKDRELKEFKEKVDLAKVAQMQAEYKDELETNPELSLIVDPTGKYNMPEEQKRFIEHYVNFKSIPTAAQLAGIQPDVAQRYFVSYETQREIRRINRALCHRQFMSKILTIDELGGWLSSLITDENVPLAAQLRTTDKLRVADMLIRLNELKGTMFNDPLRAMQTDIELEVRALSVDAIVQLLSQVDTTKEKEGAIEQIDPNRTLSHEERLYLSTLPLKDLLELVNNTTKGGDKHEP